MNPEMFSHPAVQRNLQQLEADGWQQVGPGFGVTACQEEGAGRMLEVDEILEKVAIVLG